MAKGWIKLNRELTDHWVWDGEAFTKAQAWVDLLLHANHKPTKINLKGKIILLEQGQQARSEVTLSKHWKWSRNKVRRFLNLLKTEQMIMQESAQQTSIITICNYNKYQQVSSIDETGDDTASGIGGETRTGQVTKQERGRQWNTEEECKNVRNIKNIPSEKPRGITNGKKFGDPPKKLKKSKYKYTDEHYQLAVELSNPVAQRFPSQKICWEEWADNIRKLIDIDRHTIGQIRHVWYWIQSHQGNNGFSWADNCRTPGKLRQRKDGLTYFEIIKNQIKASSERRSDQPISSMKILTDTSWADHILNQSLEQQQ